MVYNKGFTLIEIMVVVALFSFFFMKSISWISGFVSNWKVINATENLMSAVSLSRNYAIDRGKNVTLCGFREEDVCVNDGDWGSGWLIFIDDNDNGIIDSNENMIKMFNVVDNISINWNRGSHLFFNYLGESGLSGTFELCFSNGNEWYGRKIIISSSGRSRSEDFFSCES